MNPNAGTHTTDKPYPKFPKNIETFYACLDDEREAGYEEGQKDGFISGRKWEEHEQRKRRQDILRRGTEVAINCLVTYNGKAEAAYLAKMMYSAMKMMEMIK